MVPDRDLSERRAFTGIVRPLLEHDLSSIRPILETWVRDSKTGEQIPEEIAEDLDLMRESARGESERRYFVAEENGEIIGVIGMTKPREYMEPYVTTHNPVELINAYVAQEQAGGRGVGRALVNRVVEQARFNRNTEVILNSGPRYKDSAWGFYDRLPGFVRVGEIHGHYGESTATPVWSRKI